MVKKLICFGIFVFLVPIIFVLDNEYITGLGWFGIEVMHVVQYHGIQMFFCLLVLASTMFFLGLAHPKISLWFGEKTRKRSSTVYGVVAGIAIAGLIEVNVIAWGIYKYESRLLASFYEETKIGGPVGDVKNLSVSLNPNLGYSYSLSESERELIANNQNRNFVDFTFPNPFVVQHMIVETNLHPSLEDARIIGKFLLIDYRVTKSES